MEIRIYKGKHTYIKIENEQENDPVGHRIKKSILYKKPSKNLLVKVNCEIIVNKIILYYRFLLNQ